MFCYAFTLVSLNSKIDSVFAFDGILGLLNHIDEKGTLFSDSNAVLRVPEGLIGCFRQSIWILLCEFALNRGHFQPLFIIENGTKVERFELMNKIFKVHPKNAVVFVLMSQELH